MKFRVLFTMLALVAALTGCTSNNNNDWQRVVCNVQSLNGGAPLISAALNTGNNAAIPDDDFVPIDWVPALFWASPGYTNSAIPTNGTYSAFIITGYDLIWHPGPGAPANLTDYNVTGGFASARIPINDEYTVGVLVCDGAMKQDPFFQDLLSGALPSFTAFAEINFHGHEEGSEHDVVIPSGLAVNFVGSVGDN